MPARDERATYLTCPMCDVDVPMSGDEKVGEQVFCPYCQTPLKIKKNKVDDSLFLKRIFERLFSVFPKGRRKTI